MKIIHLCNSRIGIFGSIGYRTSKIINLLRKNGIITSLSLETVFLKQIEIIHMVYTSFYHPVINRILSKYSSKI